MASWSLLLSPNYPSLSLSLSLSPFLGLVVIVVFGFFSTFCLVFVHLSMRMAAIAKDHLSICPGTAQLGSALLHTLAENAECLRINERAPPNGAFLAVHNAHKCAERSSLCG